MSGLLDSRGLPKPAALHAATLNLYPVLSSNPVTVNFVTAPSAVPASVQSWCLTSRYSILYFVIWAPPSKAGGCHDNSTALWVILLYLIGPNGGRGLSENISFPKVIKLFSCSNQLSMKFIMHININMSTSVGILIFNTCSMIDTTSEIWELESKPKSLHFIFFISSWNFMLL